ncbi:hypothetical protein LG855_000002 [Vibrio alginolyticus]|nr:hypothetical protein [Vibrio alginolyticus]
MTISFQYPSPANWQDFERMLRDLYFEFDVEISGSSGQAQYGIDLVDANNNIVIQAKKRAIQRDPITIKEVVEWAEKAKEYFAEAPFKRLYIVTTQLRDINLQTELKTYLQKTPLPYNVRILFWDDLEDKLNQMPELVRKYYLTELYDDETIAQYRQFSLDHYIQFTLFGKYILSDGRHWPAVNKLVNNLKWLIHPSYDHKQNHASLLKNLAPLAQWVRLMECEFKEFEKRINGSFNKDYILPVEWRSTHLHRLREHDLISVLETEREYLNFIRAIASLLAYTKKHPDHNDWSQSDKFKSLGKAAYHATEEFKACMADNAESLAAYESLQANLKSRGFDPMQLLASGPKTNCCFGYYGYRYTGDSSSGDVYINTLPHVDAGCKDYLVLKDAKRRNYIRSSKTYYTMWPEHRVTSINLF